MSRKGSIESNLNKGTTNLGEIIAKIKMTHPPKYFFTLSLSPPHTSSTPDASSSVTTIPVI